jgi:CheY-like chemotaxis protein
MNKTINILLVEDNLADIKLIKEAFKNLTVNYDLSIVTDGQEAISYLQKQNEYANVTEPHIVLLDLNLPKKSGYEVLEEIKNDEMLKHIPFIILSTSKNGALKAYKLLANSYLVKPVDFYDFLDLVKTLEAYWFYKAVLPAL